jgi:integrase
MPRTAPLRLVDETRTPEPIKFNFTKTALSRLTPSDRRRWLYDANCNGLALSITPKGSKAFYFAKRIAGRYRRIKIGEFPDITVEQARNIATKYHGKVANGVDVAEERRAARASMTFAEAFNLYLEKHAKVHKKTWRDDEANYNRHFKQWAGRRLDGLKRSDVQTFHAKLGKKSPVMANRMLALLSKIFNFATSSGCDVSNPVAGITRFKESSRNRFMDVDELPGFLAALDTEENTTMRDYLKTLLFTGQRRRNVAMMRWDELDLKVRKLWTIPAAKFKTGNAHEVPIVPALMDILEARQTENQHRDEPQEYVFPNHRTNSKRPYLDEPRKAFNRVCAEAGITGLVLHDLRRTVGTWATAQGVPFPVVAAMLGHSVETSNVTAIYARATPQAVRDGFERTVNAMLEAKGAENA